MKYNNSRGISIMKIITITLEDLLTGIFDWALISKRTTAFRALMGLLIIRVRIGNVTLGHVVYENETPKSIALELKERYKAFNNFERIEKELGEGILDHSLKKTLGEIGKEVGCITKLMDQQTNALILGNKELKAGLEVILENA
jgi:hypothetical protein